jgi:hypothetical protein
MCKNMSGEAIDVEASMSDEKLEAFIRDGVAEIDASRRRANVRGG